MNPHGIIEIDGFRWDSWKHKRLFSRLSVELTTGEASEVVWEVFDPNFKFLDRYSKADGLAFSTVRVWLGLGPNLGEPVFKGLLARVERGEAKSTFRCYDMGFKMRLVQRTEYHKGDDLAIIAKLADRNGLQFKGPVKPLELEPHKAMAQDGQTDWEHAAERAHDAGLLLWVREDTLFADYPAKVGVPKLVLMNRRDFRLLRDFDLTFRLPENKEGRPKGIEVRGRGRGAKRLSGESEQGKRGHDELRIKQDLATHTKKKATARARAQKELDREHAFSLYIRTIPSADGSRVDVRDTVAIAGVGKLFSSFPVKHGEAAGYIAGKVAHDLTPGRLTTSFELYRDVKE